MHPPEAHQGLAALHPIGRMGDVSDVVDAVLYWIALGLLLGRFSWRTHCWSPPADAEPIRMTPLELAWSIGPATLQADRPSPPVWRETSDGQIDKIDGRKRTERHRGQRFAHIEPAEVDRKIAGLFDDLANLGLRGGIIAR
jgi:hypothetical protein